MRGQDSRGGQDSIGSPDSMGSRIQVKSLIPLILFSPGLPPPLPPHGIPVIRPTRPDYRPPVPPHRNIGVTASIVQTGAVDQVSDVSFFTL